MVSVHLRVFQKIPFLDSLAEICIGKKLIILAVNFAGARRSRGAGDRIKKIGGLTNPSTSVVLPAPDGAETTKRIPRRLNFLLKILGLLANLLQFRLASDDAL